MFVHYCRTVLIRLGFISKPTYLARVVSDHPSPEDMVPGWIYVVGGSNYQKWAYLHCPTESGEIMQLSLQSKQHPYWRINIDWLCRPTVTPSIRQLTYPYAHYWIREGIVVWCKDSGNPSHLIQNSYTLKHKHYATNK